MFRIFAVVALLGSLGCEKKAGITPEQESHPPSCTVETAHAAPGAPAGWTPRPPDFDRPELIDVEFRDYCREQARVTADRRFVCHYMACDYLGSTTLSVTLMYCDPASVTTMQGTGTPLTVEQILKNTSTTGR